MDFNELNEANLLTAQKAKNRILCTMLKKFTKNLYYVLESKLKHLNKFLLKLK